MIFEVKGRPQGKARARTFYNSRIGKMQSITPESTKSYEDLIRWSYVSAGGKYLGEKLISVKIQAFYSIPKSWSKKKQMQSIAYNIRPTTPPDLDNHAKIVLDALNGVAYCDDKQVVDLIVSKNYTNETPYTRITVEVLN